MCTKGTKLSCATALLCVLAVGYMVALFAVGIMQSSTTQQSCSTGGKCVYVDCSADFVLLTRPFKAVLPDVRALIQSVSPK